MAVHSGEDGSRHPLSLNAAHHPFESIRSPVYAEDLQGLVSQSLFIHLQDLTTCVSIHQRMALQAVYAYKSPQLSRPGTTPPCPWWCRSAACGLPPAPAPPPPPPQPRPQAACTHPPNVQRHSAIKGGKSWRFYRSGLRQNNALESLRYKFGEGHCGCRFGNKNTVNSTLPCLPGFKCRQHHSGNTAMPL